MAFVPSRRHTVAKSSLAIHGKPSCFSPSRISQGLGNAPSLCSCSLYRQPGTPPVTFLAYQVSVLSMAATRKSSSWELHSVPGWRRSLCHRAKDFHEWSWLHIVAERQTRKELCYGLMARFSRILKLAISSSSGPFSTHSCSPSLSLLSSHSFLSLVMSTKAFVSATLLAAASASSVPRYFQKRWDTSLCATNPGVAVPDSDTLQLPLENYRSDLCWGLCVGDQNACTTMSQICYTFSGANLVFNYSAVPGFTYTETDIWLGLSAPSGTPQSQYTSSNGACSISADSTTASCTIPYSSIITSGDVLSGMCPNGDSAGLTFYLYTNAMLNNNNGTGSVPAEGRLSCSDYPTCSSYLPDTYWELYYRCTDCPSLSSSSPAPSSTPSSSSTPVSPVTPSSSSVTFTSCTSSIKPTSTPSKAKSTPCTTGPGNHPTPSSTTQYCTFGTAFGYSTSCSQTFQSMSRCPTTCQRWGWYETFTSSQISKGLSGPLYVGAGGNDQSKAINVGSWSAQMHQDGKIYVYYSAAGGYSLGQVMVDVGCAPISSCNPSGFDYTFSPAQGTTSFTTGGMAVPSCGKNGSPYLIVQATINSANTVWGWPGQPGSYQCQKPVCN